MMELPARPNVDQLHRQAKELLRSAKAGDTRALAELRAVSPDITLARAQLALARRHGFASWPRLTAEVERRTLDVDELVAAFCRATIEGQMRRAAALLDAAPELGEQSFAVAVVIGNAPRVESELARDPGAAVRADPTFGWTPLHAACASRWHLVDEGAATGLADTARALVAHGADPTGTVLLRRHGGDWTPLGCAVGSSSGHSSNHAVIDTLLALGATADDRDLYLGGFAGDRAWLLPRLLASIADVGAVAEQALASSISEDDAASARHLLEAGARPSRFRNDEGAGESIVWAAVRAGCGVELLDELLGHGADPDVPGPDGRSAYRLANALGRADLRDTLERAGADTHLEATDRLLAACLSGDLVEVERLVGQDPGLVGRLSADDPGTLVRVAETGDAVCLGLMLDIGLPIEAPGADGGTPLHAAAYAGSVETARLLLDRGAAVGARDATWDSTPIVWAAVGSGERPTSVAAPDWIAVVELLLAAGAAPDEVDLTEDNTKPPSAEVEATLRRHLDGHTDA